MNWLKPEAKYDYDIAKKIRAEGCRELKRKEMECRVVEAESNRCAQLTHEYNKCARILKYVINET
jgi:hypothetical protein